MRIATVYKSTNPFAPNKRAQSHRIVARMDSKGKVRHNHGITVDIDGAPTEAAHQRAAMALLASIPISGTVQRVCLDTPIGMRWAVLTNQA